MSCFRIIMSVNSVTICFQLFTHCYTCNTIGKKCTICIIQQVFVIYKIAFYVINMGKGNSLEQA